MDERPSELTLRLRMEPTAVLGFPWFAEVTLANDTDGSEYYDLGPCDPWSPPFPVELAFANGNTRVVLPSSSAVRPRPGRGTFDLLPGEARTFVLDISELEPSLTAGPWQCHATWVMQHEQPRSHPVSVELSTGRPADLAKLRQLRLAGGSRSPSWLNFVELGDFADVRTVQRRLSEQARHALLPYVFMHEAVHGPEPLARLAPDTLLQFREGAWASEAALLWYELAGIRGAADQAQRRVELLSRWPGLAFRVAEIERGVGILTRLRLQYGPREQAL